MTTVDAMAGFIAGMIVGTLYGYMALWLRRVDDKLRLFVEKQKAEQNIKKEVVK